MIADSSKNSVKLGDGWKKGIPVEVIPMAFVTVSLKLEKMGLKPVLRMAKAKAGPLVTDNNNFILDVGFDDITNWESVNADIIKILVC